MLFSDEDLIAYLLGDAPVDVTQHLEQQLSVDRELLERLTSFRQMLGQIDSLGGMFEPPSDLVDTTLDRIDQLASSVPDVNSLVPVSSNPEASDSALDSSQGELNSTEDGPCSPVDAASRVGLSPSWTGRPRRTSVWDSAALTVSLTVLCCLLLPAMIRVRFESRRAQCARNLELTGSELIGYALNNPQGRFPFVALDGPEAFAGVYAVYLREAGGLISSGQLRCASLLGVPGLLSRQPLTAVGSERSSIPDFAELHRLDAEQLRMVQLSTGGDYAYNLGVAEKGSPQAPKCQGRSHFAILADAPVFMVSNRNSAPKQEEQFVAHEGKGINIFYEDGHVRFVALKSLGSLELADSGIADNPFENQRGAHEFGLHPQDASLAPSHFAPLGR